MKICRNSGLEEVTVIPPADMADLKLADLATDREGWFAIHPPIESRAAAFT